MYEKFEATLSVFMRGPEKGTTTAIHQLIHVYKSAATAETVVEDI